MSDKTKQGILSLTIKDRTVLYAAYMPFLRNGGLFIPTNKRFTLGEEVFVLLALMDEAEKIPITGTVVWVTPRVRKVTDRLVLACSSQRRTLLLPQKLKSIWALV
jgi:Tfp pilus assembly protein PilZ